MGKRVKAKKKPTISAEKVRQHYVDYILEYEKKPSTVFKFCKSIGIEEHVFYKYYGSFKAIEKAIWREYATVTIDRLKSDNSYATFSAREKVLAFYYTLVEVLNQNKSFIAIQLSNKKSMATSPVFMRKFRKEFDLWVNEVLEEGRLSGEIVKRPYIDQRYGALLWIHLGFILMFWQRDDSVEFEKTDEAIEKSVNLAFDVMGKGLVDDVFNFGKFLIQTARG